MTGTWYNTAERVAALLEAAESWRGTPFFPNSNTKGPRGGVSCQKLASALYRESGFAAIEVPEVSMGHAKFSLLSLLEQFMRLCPHFLRLESEASLPGDLIAFRVKSTTHHMGIVLPGRAPGQTLTFVQALDGVGVVRSELSDGTYLSRLAAAWRPVA